MARTENKSPNSKHKWRLGQFASTDIKLNIAAVLVGGGTGLGAVLFIWLLGQVGQGAAWLSEQIGNPIGLLIVMAVAGLIVGAMINQWAIEAKGHGVPEVMEAIALKGGRIRAQVAAVKVLASSITIGVGGSAGREGPIVQVGSALGSTLGCRLKLADDAIPTLVACGSAAGIAATFNAPIAGAIFALEVILGRFTIRHFSSVVLSSVTGSIVGRAFLSDQVAFRVPSYPLNHVGELPIYIVLSVLAAFVAILFIKTLYSAEHFFDNWSVPMPVKTAIGLAATGAISLLMPDWELLGSGIDMIGELITDDFDVPLSIMAALLLLKLCATTATLGSGNSGGVFAPALFMGASLGGMVGTVAQQWFPNVVAHPGAYAIVGMAAVFSASARAPITAILIVFEMSNDYQLILPLMLTTVLATLFAERMMSESIYTLKLAERGIHLQDGRDVDVLDSIAIADVMERDVLTVSDKATLGDLLLRLSHSHQHGFPIVDADNRLRGIVTLGDMEHALERNESQELSVLEIGQPRDVLLVMFAEQSIGAALQAMGRVGIGRIPIVAHDNPDQLEGLITRDNIVNAYTIGLSRRAELQHHAKAQQRENLDETEFVDVMVSAETASRNHTIRDLAPLLPPDCVLVSIRRNGQLIIPHGDTQLQADDLITAFVNQSERQAMLAVLQP